MTLAVLDACVLFQGRLTNLLLCVAEARVFEPVWSAEIHHEWSRNLAASNLAMSAEKIAYRKSEMQRAFPAADCEIDPSVVEEVQRRCHFPRQRKDAHVVATAIASEATVIVTENLRDFAPDVLAYYGLSKMRAETFCLQNLKHRPIETLCGITVHRRSMLKTPMTPQAYLAYLEAKMGLIPTSLEFDRCQNPSPACGRGKGPGAQRREG